MRHILLLFVCLASPMLCAQDAGADELPLYREFRVLSGLPWKEAGATRKTVLERIFHEPDTLVRREVLREYLQTTLPVEEFPEAFDECIALEQADFPGAVPEFVMRAWAERDPAAAIKRCASLFDLVIEGAPLKFDDWSKPIHTGDREKACASSYWFGSRGVVHACWMGLAAAALPPERRKELEAEFVADYARRFQEDPPKGLDVPAQRRGRTYGDWSSDDRATISTDAGMRNEFLHLLAAAPEEIPRILHWPREPWRDVLFSRGLIRWMNGDAKKAPQIVERVLDAYDPRRSYRDDPAVMRVVPIEFLVEWAILDHASFIAWAEEKPRGSHTQAVYLAVMPEANEYHVRLEVGARRSKVISSEGDQLWITLDPQGALPRLSRGNKESDISAALDNIWRSDPPPNYWRRIVAPYASLYGHSSLNEAWDVTTVLGPVDFRAMVKQYGMPWCLRSGELKESQVIPMFRNRQPMKSKLRNTFSALRTWAILRPKEMRAWIDGETFTPAFREALLWLLDNAASSFPVPPAAEPR